jgi:phage shock protein B
MQGVFVTAIIFGGIVVSMAIVGATILMGIRIIKGGVSRKDRQRDAEDAATIQEIYQNMTRMEERVEALETILYDRRGDHATD